MLHDLCLTYYRSSRAAWYVWRKKDWSPDLNIPPRNERLSNHLFKHAIYWRSRWQIYKHRGF